MLYRYFMSRWTCNYIQIIIYCDFQFKYRFQNKIGDQISKNVKWISIKWKLVQIRIYRQKWKLENKTEKDSKVIKLSINLWNLFFMKSQSKTCDRKSTRPTENWAVCSCRCPPSRTRDPPFCPKPTRWINSWKRSSHGSIPSCQSSRPFTLSWSKAASLPWWRWISPAWKVGKMRISRM